MHDANASLDVKISYSANELYFISCIEYECNVGVGYVYAAACSKFLYGKAPDTKFKRNKA